MTVIAWGAPGLDLLAMGSADKRHGGSSTSKSTPQAPKATKKGAPVVKRPTTRRGGNTSR